MVITIETINNGYIITYPKADPLYGAMNSRVYSASANDVIIKVKELLEVKWKEKSGSIKNETSI